MILHKFSIFDVKVGAYATPFFMRSKGEAMRAFVWTVADPSTQPHRTPADFTLFYLGAFDDQTGKFESVITPEPIYTGQEAAALEQSREIAMSHFKTEDDQDA